MRKARERSRDSLKISSFREVDTWQLHEADNWTSPSTGPQLTWRHFPDRNVNYLKWWYLDETEVPEENLSQLSREGNLTTNSSRITESLCNYNRAKQEFCTCSKVFGTFLPRYETTTRWNFTFYAGKKSTQVDDFFFLSLNWLEYGQSFLRHETVNGGDRKREFLSVAKQTLYFHSYWISVNYSRVC